MTMWRRPCRPVIFLAAKTTDRKVRPTRLKDYILVDYELDARPDVL
jgi:hypothetical protein